MKIASFIRCLGAAVLATSGAVLVAQVPAASAQPCSDVEVVFARGTGEAPGVGGVGQAFVDSLRSQVGGRTVSVYAVNYPASNDFADTSAFVGTVIDGIRDAGNHVQATAAACPNTRIVLGGFSQGAVVAGFTTADRAPAGIPSRQVPAPLPAEVANHVAAVTLFGKPSPEFLRQYGAPAITIGPLYAPKTIDLCNTGDTICNGAPDGGPTVAHALYGVNGMTNEAAAFAADRV